MPLYHEIVQKQIKPMEWPYPILYEHAQEIETDVLVIGGGTAGCWAAISAARKGLRVALVEKSATVRSGAVGPSARSERFYEKQANNLRLLYRCLLRL